MVILEAGPEFSCVSEKTWLGWTLDEAPAMSVCRSGAVSHFSWDTKALF